MAGNVENGSNKDGHTIYKAFNEERSSPDGHLKRAGSKLVQIGVWSTDIATFLLVNCR